MRHKFRQTLLVIVSFVLLALFAHIAFVAIPGIRAFTSLDSDVAAAIIAASATIFVSVLSIILGKIYETRAYIQKEHREKKIPVYEDLIKFTFSSIMGTRTGAKPTESEILEFMSDFTQRIMVWGSDDVLAAWIKLRRAALNEEELKSNPVKLLLLYEQLILTIRRDLGHKNRNLDTGDVLALFVNDIDQQLKEKVG